MRLTDPRVLSLACTCVLAACGGPAGPEEPGTFGELSGEWLLVRQCGGFTGECLDGSGADWLELTQQDSVLLFSESVRTFAAAGRLVESAPTPSGTYPSIEVWSEAEDAWNPLFAVLHQASDSLRLRDFLADGYTFDFERM